MPTTFGIEITGEPSPRGPPAEPRSPRPHPTRPLRFLRERGRQPRERSAAEQNGLGALFFSASANRRRDRAAPGSAIPDQLRDRERKKAHAGQLAAQTERRDLGEDRFPHRRAQRHDGKPPAAETGGQQAALAQPDDRRRAERARLAQSGIAKRGDDRAPGARRRRDRGEHGPRGEFDFGWRLDRRESEIGIHGDHVESIAGDATSLFAQPSSHPRIRVRIDDPQFSLGHLLPFTHFNPGDPAAAIG